MAKFKFSVATQYVGSRWEETFEVPDEDLEGCTEEEREKVVRDYFEQWVWENIDTDWGAVE